jgi:Zn-finger nucleic acid-binding protein
MDCPRCESQLLSESFDGITVDRCMGCRGMWLDPGELDQMEDAAFDQVELKGSVMYRSFQGVLYCPKCGDSMHAFHYRAYDLELDFCINEEGILLDGGEEERVLQIMRVRSRDLKRSGKAEEQWARLMRSIKSRSFKGHLRGSFRK